MIVTRFLSGLAIACLFSGCIQNQSPEHPRSSARTAMDQYRNLPVPAGNVRVNIERHQIRNTDRVHVGAALRYRGPHVTVAAGSAPIGMWHVRDGFSAALTASARKTGHHSTQRQFLMLQPETEASMQLLESRPQPWTVVVPVYDGAVIVDTFREEVTGTGFFVAVHSVSAKQVDLELTPWFRSTREKGVLKIEELSTRVMLQPGVPAVIMSDDTENSRVTKQLLSYGAHHEQSELMVLLTVDVGGQ